ncbi:MAG: Ig-like domain-containing protein [Candidatus Scalindua sp.]|nr:Ig-like domain-containing protein [Candidatus Scalindua sp.]
MSQKNVLSQLARTLHFRCSISTIISFVVLTLAILINTSNLCSAQADMLLWDPNSEDDLAGYKVHYGTSSGNYNSHEDVGNQTSYTLTGLGDGNDYYLAVTAYDFSGNESTYSNEVVYNDLTSVNSPPVLTAIGNKTVNENQALNLIISATDPEGDTLAYTASNLPSGASFDENSRTFSWTPTYSQAGTYSNVTFHVSDSKETDSESITITVNDADITPVPNVSVTNLTVSSNKAYKIVENGLQNGGLVYIDRGYTYSAIPVWLEGATYINTANNDKSSNSSSFLSFDVNKDVIVYVAHDDRITPKPSWLKSSFTDIGENLVTTDTTLSLYASNVISGTITLGGNEGSGKSMYTFVIVGQEVAEVNNAPVLDPLSGITVNEGDTVTLAPTATDADGDTLTFSYSGWMTSASYTTTHDDAGDHAVTVTVSDGTASDTQVVTITVNNVNQAPVLSTLSPVMVNEGDTVTLAPTATDADGDTLTFSYSGWMTSASYTTSYDDAGDHTVTVTVSDGTASDSQVVTITVNNVNRAPVLNPISGTGGDIQGTLFWDPNNEEDLAGYKVYYGTASGNYGSHTDVGIQTYCLFSGLISGETYYAAVTAYDSSGNESIYSGEVSFVAQDLENVVIVEEGDTVTLTPTAADPDGDALTFSYSGWMTSRSYTTNYNDAGTHTVTVTVSDGASIDSQDVTITVVDVMAHVNAAPLLDHIAGITVNEGDTVTLTPTASDPDGDPLTFSYSGWMTSASYTTSYNDAGDHAVTVTVSDGTASDTQSVTVTVNNVNQAPVLAHLTAVTVNEGDTVTLAPTASDPDGDPLTFSYSGWMTSASYGTSYDDAGDHIVTVTVSDGAASDSQSVTVTVNNVDITPEPDLSVTNLTVSSNQAYEIVENGLQKGGLVYIDRGYTYSAIPVWMEGVTYIKTANNDKASSSSSFLSFDVNKDVIVYVAHDDRITPKPSWLESSYTDIGEDLVTTDTTLSLYASNVISGTITLGGNEGAGKSMYTVVIVEQEEAGLNNAPVLDPLTNITVNEGDTVTFNPTATDPDGDALAFSYSGWMTSASYTTSYNDAGDHTVTVTVSDGSASDSQSVTVTVTNINRAPVLDAIPSIVVNEGVTITLNPTASDPDDDPLTYTYSGWMTSSAYTTTAQDAGGHTVTVTVSDGELTDYQDVTITVLDTNSDILAWDENTEEDIAGYKVYYGISSSNYDDIIDVGNQTTYDLSDLVSGVTYYLAVTAYNSSGNESGYSNEVLYDAN